MQKIYNFLYQYAATSYLVIFAWWVPDAWQEGDRVIAWMGAAAAIPMIAVASAVYLFLS